MSERELYLFLARGRRRLNLIVLAAALARALVWATIAFGPAVLLARWLGWPGNALLSWGSLTILGGFVGLGLGWRQRLDRVAAARWLDRSLRLDEALSAALFCLGRRCSGPLDAGVVARAVNASARKSPIHWPWRYLCRWSLLAVGLTILSGLAVAFWRPGQAAPVTTPARGPAASRIARAAPGEIPPTLGSPREAARILFAQDPVLARQAEQALQAGDTEMLQRLLRAAERKMQDRIAQAATPAERRLLQQEQQRQREMGKALLRGDSSATDETDQTQSPAPNAGQRPGRIGAAPKPSGERGAGILGPEDEDMVRRRQDFQRDPGLAGSSADRGPAGSLRSGGMSGTGLQAGRGAGQSRGQWGEITGKSGKQQAVIGRDQNQTLEYVLPGKNARIPLALAVSEARRVAEGAVARADVPLEYLESVRAYFLALSRVTTTAPKGVLP